MRRQIVILAALVTGLVLWIVLASSRSQGSEAAEMIAMVGVAAACFGVGLRLIPWTAPLAAMVLVSCAAVLYIAYDPLTRSPSADPLGYANANGALYVQMAALAGMAATRVRQPAARISFVLVSLSFASLPFIVGSAAAAITGLAVAVALLVGLTTRASVLARWWPIVAGALVVLAAVGTVVLAEHYGNGDPDDYCYRCDVGLIGEPRVLTALSERRVELWRDAERLAREQPLWGVGPGRFDEVSPIAKFDEDTQAAHSALLEQGAETGLVGALLLLALGLTVIVGLREIGSGAGLVAIAGWTAFCLHAQVDYIADFPAVVAAAALVAGLGTTATRPQVTH